MTRVFLRPLRLVRAAAGEPLTLGRVADCLTVPQELAQRMAALPVGRAPQAGRFAVLGLTELVERVLADLPDADVRLLGAGGDVVVESRRPPSLWRALLGVAVWLLLAIGAATAILNFHADVNMPAAHREIYRLLTGRRAERPPLIEVPYAIGVGAGILLFFRRPGRRGPFSGEPSPLELELARYEARLADYWRNGQVREP